MSAPKTRKCPICYTTRKAGNADDSEHRLGEVHRQAVARLEALMTEHKQRFAKENAL